MVSTLGSMDADKMNVKQEKKLIRLKSQIMKIIELYTPLIGCVPLKMLEYHLKQIPYENSRDEIVRNRDGSILIDEGEIIDYTPEELGICLKELLHDKRLSRDVVAYKAVERKPKKMRVIH